MDTNRVGTHSCSCSWPSRERTAEAYAWGRGGFRARLLCRRLRKSHTCMLYVLLWSKLSEAGVGGSSDHVLPLALVARKCCTLTFASLYEYSCKPVTTRTGGKPAAPHECRPLRSKASAGFKPHHPEQEGALAGYDSTAAVLTCAAIRARCGVVTHAPPPPSPPYAHTHIHGNIPIL